MLSISPVITISVSISAVHGVRNAAFKTMCPPSATVPYGLLPVMGTEALLTSSRSSCRSDLVNTYVTRTPRCSDCGECSLSREAQDQVGARYGSRLHALLPSATIQARPLKRSLLHKPARYSHCSFAWNCSEIPESAVNLSEG